MCRTFVLFLFSRLMPLCALAQVHADDILGVWLTSGKEQAKIKIYKSGEKYEGKIIWLKNPTIKNKPILDANNPDKSKRNHEIVGLVILKDFEFDGSDEWEDGKIYDPENGKTYSCYM